VLCESLCLLLGFLRANFGIVLNLRDMDRASVVAREFLVWWGENYVSDRNDDCLSHQGKACSFQIGKRGIRAG
jgi:hypothetical protein